MSECKIPFFHSGIYKRKINKVILPPNLQGAQQMQQTAGRQREGKASGFLSCSQKCSLMVEGQVSERVHRGHQLACWSLGMIQGPLVIKTRQERQTLALGTPPLPQPHPSLPPPCESAGRIQGTCLSEGLTSPCTVRKVKGKSFHPLLPILWRMRLRLTGGGNMPQPHWLEERCWDSRQALWAVPYTMDTDGTPTPSWDLPLLCWTSLQSTGTLA